MKIWSRSQWVDKKGNILTGNQPDFPMKYVMFLSFSLKPINWNYPRLFKQRCKRDIFLKLAKLQVLCFLLLIYHSHYSHYSQIILIILIILIIFIILRSFSLFSLFSDHSHHSHHFHPPSSHHVSSRIVFHVDLSLQTLGSRGSRWLIQVRCRQRWLVYMDDGKDI